MKIKTASEAQLEMLADMPYDYKSEMVQVLLWNAAFIAYGVVFYFLLVSFFG